MRPVAQRLAVFTAAATLALSPAISSATVSNGDVDAQNDAIDQLADDLDAILTEHADEAGLTSVLVHDADGEALYATTPSTRQVPASNTKLVTAAAALEVLGREHVFATDVLADGRRNGAALNGNLYLRGGGDPTMLAADYDELAAKVAAESIEVVRGDLIADDTRFDPVRLGWGWSWTSEPYYYGAQISALTVAPDEDYDAGSVIVETQPGAAPGEPATTAVIPETDYVTITNEVTTSADGEPSVTVERQRGTNEIVVSGTIPVDADPHRAWSSVWEPTGYAADVFASALAEHGVRVTGSHRLGESTPEDARQLATHESMPLADLLVPFMKLSNNGHAEVLVKEMGAEAAGDGSWDAGLEVAQDALAELGLAPTAYHLADGSGLSRANFITAEQFATLLAAAEERPWFDAFDGSLPVAGDPDRLIGGTLRSRMQGTAAEGNARAKTGSLTGASGLSGYVTSQDDERLVFSILQNNYLDTDVKHVEDLIVVRLAEFSRDGQSSSTGASPVRSSGPAGIECSWVKSTQNC